MAEKKKTELQQVQDAEARAAAASARERAAREEELQLQAAVQAAEARVNDARAAVASATGSAERVASEAELQRAEARLAEARAATGPRASVERVARATVGRSVHYHPSEPDGRRFGQDRFRDAGPLAGTITRLNPPSSTMGPTAELFVLSPTSGPTMLSSVEHSEDGAPGTWTWPPRV